MLVCFVLLFFLSESANNVSGTACKSCFFRIRNLGLKLLYLVDVSYHVVNSKVFSVVIIWLFFRSIFVYSTILGDVICWGLAILNGVWFVLPWWFLFIYLFIFFALYWFFMISQLYTISKKDNWKKAWCFPWCWIYSLAATQKTTDLWPTSIVSSQFSDYNHIFQTL